MKDGGFALGHTCGTVARYAVPLVNYAVWFYALFALCAQLGLSPVVRGWTLVGFVVVWSVGRGFMLELRKDARSR